MGNAPTLDSLVFSGNGGTVYYLPGTTGWGTTFGGFPTVLLPYIYTINNGVITITEYAGIGGAVTIPDTISGLPVTSIGDSAFNGCISLTQIIIPNSVNYIGSAAFGGTSLSNVIIPDSVTSIGAAAFGNCISLTNVTLPNHLTSIEDDTFFYCLSLTSVIIPNSVTSIGNYAFSRCPSLSNVIFGKSVGSIGLYAFWADTSLTTIFFQGNSPSYQANVFVGAAANAVVYYLPGTTGWGSTFGGTEFGGEIFGAIPTMLWNPQMQTNDGSFGVQTNCFIFDITGSSNLVIVVEACSNLFNPVWQPVQTNILTTGSVCLVIRNGRIIPPASTAFVLHDVVVLRRILKTIVLATSFFCQCVWTW